MKNQELHETAKQILLHALETCDSASLPTDSVRNLIDKVVEGHHKTYRYILFTAITAKAANPDLNPLVLQKKANTWGTYDARSLCHRVLVPFERTYLKNALGGSNEPFLNKPARFEMLTTENAVRSGNDRTLLNLMCSTLPEINSQTSAWSALCYLMKLLREKAAKAQSRFVEPQMERGRAAIEVRRLLKALLEFNHRGEILTLTVAGILNEFLRDDSAYRIEVHNLNQSGASSREIADLDVYKDERIFALFELKDKDFSIADVQHATRKAIDNGCDNLNFIYGTNASFDREAVSQYKLFLTEDSFYLTVMSVESFIDSLLTLAPSLNPGRMLNYMINTAIVSRFGEDTKSLLFKVGLEFIDDSELADQPG